MLEFRILGPVEVVADGRRVEIPQARQRALLALLLLNANRIVPADRLIDALWGESPPKNAANALQVSVSRLRKRLPDNGAPLVQTRHAGYVIELDPAQLDLARFERLSAEGRDSLGRGEPENAARILRDALGVWHGPALADLASEAFVQHEAERLEESRLTALELRIEAELASGEHSSLVAELEALVAAHPYREGFCAQLMLALYRAGRQAEALEAYQRLRRRLVDELGIEPSRSLQQLERSILQQDPTLELPDTAAARLAEARAARALDAASGVAEAARAQMTAIESEVARSLVELHDARERSTRPTAAERDVTVCPFKGLAPFEEEDADLFFGRERLLAELVARAVGSRLVCITGPSGSGKSSLLRAGLLPSLARGVLPGTERWARCLLRPGTRPAESLRTALDAPSGGSRVVAVDQLEEVFTLCQDDAERAAFLASLVELALADDPRSLVVVAVRADFYGHFASHPGLAALLGTGTVLVGPMTEDELQRAVEGPAERAGLRLDAGLAETLVAEAADEPGALPLLQTALLELWKAKEDETLTLRAFGRTGGLRGAVARLAEDAFGRLEGDAQSATRTILLRLADDEGGAVVRRRVPIAELDAAAGPRRSAVDALIESRLVIVDDGTAEVAHEALFREWPRLRAWLEEDAESRVIRRALSDAAAAWESGGRDVGDLYRGARLASTLTWASERPAELTSLERAFLDASRTDAEQESERQRRVNRRLRGLLGGVLMLLVVAVVAGGVALAQRSTARQSATEATAERLGAQALVESDLDLSLLLARQAVAISDSPQARGNLLAALLRSPAAVRVTRPLPGRILGLSASPASTTVVVTSNEGQVALVHTLTGESIATTSADAGFVSADGRSAMTMRRGGAYEVLDPATGGVVERGTLPGFESGRAWHITADLDVVSVVDGAGKRVTLWRRADGRELGGVDAPSGVEIVDAYLSPEGTRVLTLGVPAPAPANWDEIHEMDLTVWDASTGRPLWTLADQPAFPTLALSPDGATLAVAGEDYAVRLHDIGSGRVQTLAGGHTASVIGISFSPDGRTVATGADDRLALVWNAATGEIVERLAGHAGRVFAPAFGKNGLVHTAGLDGSLITWDLRGDRRLGSPFPAPTAPPFTVPVLDVSPDGEVLVTAGDEGTLVVRDADTLDERARRAQEAPVTAVAFSPDGRLLAAGGYGSEVTIWDTSTWELTGGRLRDAGAPTEGRSTVRSLAFSPDGSLLVAGTDEETPVAGPVDPDLDGRLLVWDVASRPRALASIDARGQVRDVAISPDGSLVAAIVEAPDWDPRPELDPLGWAVVWSLEDRSERYRVDADGDGFGRPGGLAFSPDGGLLAVGGGDGGVRFFDAATGETRGRALRASAGWVLSLDFAPDGRTLATAGADGTVRLYDVPGRFQLGLPLSGLDNTWVRARFTPDGERVLSLYEVGRGFAWESSPEVWARRACSVAGRVLSSEEWERFLPGRPYAPACG